MPKERFQLNKKKVRFFFEISVRCDEVLDEFLQSVNFVQHRFFSVVLFKSILFGKRRRTSDCLLSLFLNRRLASDGRDHLQKRSDGRSPLLFQNRHPLRRNWLSLVSLIVFKDGFLLLFPELIPFCFLEICFFLINVADIGRLVFRQHLTTAESQLQLLLFLSLEKVKHRFSRPYIVITAHYYKDISPYFIQK